MSLATTPDDGNVQGLSDNPYRVRMVQSNMMMANLVESLTRPPKSCVTLGKLLNPLRLGFPQRDMAFTHYLCYSLENKIIHVKYLALHKYNWC